MTRLIPRDRWLDSGDPPDSRRVAEARPIETPKSRVWRALPALLLVLTACTATPAPVERTPAAPPPATGSGSPAVGSDPPAAVPSARPSANSAGPADDLAAAKRAAGIAACPVTDPEVPARTDGLPDLTLPCLGGGREVRLAGLRGRPALVNVWAQWCGPCRAEAPYLAEAAAAAPRSGLLVLGVDHRDPQPARAVAFASEAGWRYPQVADPDGRLRTEFGVTGPPQTFFVTADGRLAHRHVGPFVSTAQVRSLVATHLGVDL